MMTLTKSHDIEVSPNKIKVIKIFWPWSIDSGKVVSSQANPVDGIPLINRVQGPERFSDTIEDGADSRKSVVD